MSQGGPRLEDAGNLSTRPEPLESLRCSKNEGSLKVLDERDRKASRTNSGGSTLLNDMPSRGHSRPLGVNEKGSGPMASGANVSFQNVPLGPDTRGAATGGGNGRKKRKRTLLESARWTCWHALTYSWINVLLIFVPAGIITAQIPGIHGGIVFALNCLAVVPLAGLLAHATEAVASEMGDALGALMNVTFGNVVELIIFISLIKNKIRIVQASIIGSVLANILLILGMGFFLGGMRYREQLYNNTITQMSACLLTLSVISLVLPTAFHASFSDYRHADEQSLKISRGASVVLLLVYVIFLMFQLKSHAYMYESTPRHIVDAEAAPGPAAGWLESASAEHENSSGYESDDSQYSRDMVGGRVRRVLRGRRSRKHSMYTSECDDRGTRSSSATATNTRPETQDRELGDSPSRRGAPPHIQSGLTQEVSLGGHERHKGRKKRHFSHGKHKGSRKSRNKDHEEKGGDAVTVGLGDQPPRLELSYPDVPSVAMAGEICEAGSSSPRSPLTKFRNFTPTLFPPKPETTAGNEKPPSPDARFRQGIGRTNSPQDRISNERARPPGAMLPPSLSATTMIGNTEEDEDEDEERLSRTAAILLLVVSTGLVSACAEFLVSSIEDVTESSTLGETFIGLILLPIIGNAAEHITSITVAMKNKMDLAIGVAIGSSIQIALFITPMVVILGWALDRQMSLYFTIFETVCLFASAFIVSFLVLDGRSNYMEGALLCAVYLIIGIIAFFYPEVSETSAWGSGEEVLGEP